MSANSDLTAADKAEVAQIVGDAIAEAIRPLIDAVATNQRRINEVKRHLDAPIQARGEPRKIVGVELLKRITCSDGSATIVPL